MSAYAPKKRSSVWINAPPPFPEAGAEWFLGPLPCPPELQHLAPASDSVLSDEAVDG